VQVIPAVEESAGELTLVSVEAPAKAAPVYSQASPAGDGIADEQIVASAQAAKSASATANVVRSATNVVTGESRVSAPAEAAVETEPGAQQHALPEGSSPVQSGFVGARAELQPGAEENAATGMHHEAESDASQPGRGSADRLFLETLAQAQDGRARGVVNVTRNEASPVGNSGEARLTESIVGQTVRSVILSARGGSSELRVRLWPEHLGELHLRLVFKDNVLTLDLNTQSTVVKNVIEGNLAQLRYALQHNGVDVGKVSVMVDPDLASGGRFSRQTPVFHPFEDRWHRSFSGQQPEQDSSPAHWFGGARRRHVLCRIDLVA
jgi:flagellar hook-length control protein FliK